MLKCLDRPKPNSIACFHRLRSVIMSVRKFYIIGSVVLFCCCWIGSASFHQCPDICQCYDNQQDGKVWNCSNVVTANQLWNTATSNNHLHREIKLSQHVKHLVLQDSKVDFPEDLSRYFPNLKKLELSNSFISCTKHLIWLLPWSDKLVDSENLHCSYPQTFNGTQVLKALQLIYDVDSRCPDRCVCELAHVPKDDQYVTVSVSCNNLGFTELPKVLPANVTIHMDLSNNRVS